MKAVGYKTPGAIDRADALEDIDLPRPAPQGHDILVEVMAVSVNPVDTKVRTRDTPAAGRMEDTGLGCGRKGRGNGRRRL